MVSVGRKDDVGSWAALPGQTRKAREKVNERKRETHECFPHLYEPGVLLLDVVGAVLGDDGGDLVDDLEIFPCVHRAASDGGHLSR